MEGTMVQAQGKECVCDGYFTSHLGLGARRSVRRHTDVTVRMLGLSFRFCHPGMCCLMQRAETGRFPSRAGADAARTGAQGQPRWTAARFSRGRLAAQSPPRGPRDVS